MPSKTFEINLDLINSDYQLVDAVEVVNGDTDSNLFNINLLQNYIAVNATGNTAVIVFRKPDGTTVYQNLTAINTALGKFSCVLSSQTIVVPGEIKAEVTLYEGTKRVTSTRFKFLVRKALLDETAVQSSNEFSALTAAMGKFALYDAHLADIVQTDEVNSSTKYPSAAVTYVHGQEIDALNNRLAFKVSETSFADIVGPGYLATSLENLVSNISSHPTGVIVLDSGGGPVWHCVLCKLTDSYFSGIVMSYNGDMYFIVYRNGVRQFRIM